MARALRVGPDELLLPGTDVTEVAREWPTLIMHLKRGYLRIAIEGAEAGAAIAVAVAAPSVATVTHAADEVLDVVDAAIETLRSLDATASKFELRSALTAAGHDAPRASSKDELLRLRGEALGA